MAFTAQTVIDLARQPLNDASKQRYTDANALAYFNSAIWRAYELRPDLLIGSGWAAYTALTLAGSFPLPDRFAQTVADYIGGRLEMRDDESANSGRAVSLMSLFAKEMTG